MCYTAPFFSKGAFMNKIRVLIADDQTLFAENLKSVLENRSDDISVVGIVNDGAQAIKKTKELKPDIILMDVRMPHVDGVLAVDVIMKELPLTKIIMLTTFDDDAYVLDALKYGALGYILKDITMSELITIIISVSQGSVVISPSVAKNLVKNLNHPTETKDVSQTPPKLPNWFFKLNQREKQILKFLAKGCNNYDIAARLSIREQTVKNYVSAIYDKLDMHDRLMVLKEAESVMPWLEIL